MPVTKIKSSFSSGDLKFKNLSATEIFGINSTGISISGTVLAPVAEINDVPVQGYIASAQTDESCTHMISPHAGYVNAAYVVPHVAMSANGSATFIIYVSATSAGSLSLSGAASGSSNAVTIADSTYSIGAGGVIKARVSSSGNTGQLPVSVLAIITRD